ncbi:hypothetical protein LIER_32143 [Lithospermum erythrorhizon]|uniref:Uncharacterized protein n=1 Tax=Lithospermum erythrorhizon TaxID=34254 RepID=A0AAV3RVG5_LITER
MDFEYFISSHSRSISQLQLSNCSHCLGHSRKILSGSCWLYADASLSKISKKSMENGTMDGLLTKLHLLACQLKSIGKPITDENLVRQTLFSLPYDYSAFVTVMTTRQQYPTLSELHSLLINEEDCVKSKALQLCILIAHLQCALQISLLDHLEHIITRRISLFILILVGLPQSNFIAPKVLKIKEIPLTEKTGHAVKYATSSITLLQLAGSDLIMDWLANNYLNHLC